MLYCFSLKNLFCHSFNYEILVTLGIGEVSTIASHQDQIRWTFLCGVYVLHSLQVMSLSLTVQIYACKLTTGVNMSIKSQHSLCFGQAIDQCQLMLVRH